MRARPLVLHSHSRSRYHHDMQPVASPIPQSPLARARRQSPPAPAADPVEKVEQTTSEQVAIADELPAVDDSTSTVDDAGIPAAVAEPDATTATTEADDPKAFVAAVTQRLLKERRWRDVEPLKNAMIKEARAKGMKRDDAQLWAYGEVDRLYPPLPQAADSEGQPGVSCEANGDASPGESSSAHAREPGESSSTVNGLAGTERVTPSIPSSPENSGVRGLGDVPAAWLPLTANASLAAEIAWVQANRLCVVDESRSGQTVVRLDRAHEPAPSRAAIGWLETSIRSYAKFVDVAAKCMGYETDESSQVRRERMAIEDIRSLLDEMHCD